MFRVYFCDSDPLILSFTSTLFSQFLQENRNFRSLVFLMITNKKRKLCLKEIFVIADFFSRDLLLNNIVK